PLTEGEQRLSQASQLLGGTGGEHKQVAGPGHVAAFDPGRFFNDEVGIGATEAEGAGRGTTRLVVTDSPGARAGSDVKQAVLRRDPRVGGGGVEGGRDLFMLQGHEDLEDTG